MIAASSGIWLVTAGHQRIAVPILGLALIFAAVYVALVGQAIKRGKVVEYWEDRRELRWELSRQEAYSRLLSEALDQMGRLRGRRPSEVEVSEAYQAMVEAAYAVFAPAYDDLAVLLAYQIGEHCQVISSKLSPGSRWHALRSGKRCCLEGDFAAKLEELSHHHHARQIASFFNSETDLWSSVDSWRGTLWFVTLQDSELSKDDVDLLDPMLSHFELISEHWHPAFLSSESNPSKPSAEPIGSMGR
jgi:hypothetical protein